MSTDGSRVNFLPPIKLLASQRAGYKCSFPECGKVTIGPGPTPDTVSKLGKAAHIYAASPNGPRGQGAMSEDQLRSVRNCIWLCSTHADLVDLHRGEKFPASVLYGYRDLHESRVSRELGDLPSLNGWVESITLGPNPFFAAGTKIQFGKSTVFHGPNGTGKTAVLEWMATAFSSELASRWDRTDFSLDVRFLDSVRAHDIEFAHIDSRAECVVDGKAVPFNPLDLTVVFVVKEGPEGVLASRLPLERIAEQVGITPQDAAAVIPFISKDPESIISRATVEGTELEITFRDGRARNMPFFSLSASLQELVVIECAIAHSTVLSGYRPVMLCLDADFGIFDRDNASAVLQRVSSPDLQFQTVVVVHDDRADLEGWQVYEFEGRDHPKTIKRMIGA